jgi:hypothetical protein
MFSSIRAATCLFKPASVPGGNGQVQFTIQTSPPHPITTADSAPRLPWKPMAATSTVLSLALLILPRRMRSLKLPLLMVMGAPADCRDGRLRWPRACGRRHAGRDLQHLDQRYCLAVDSLDHRAAYGQIIFLTRSRKCRTGETRRQNIYPRRPTDGAKARHPFHPAVNAHNKPEVTFGFVLLC